jgi:hypothetical protein
MHFIHIHSNLNVPSLVIGLSRENHLLQNQLEASSKEVSLKSYFYIYTLQ